MASSRISSPFTFLLLTIFICSAVARHSPHSSSLITTACTDPNACMKIFGSEPKIVSAKNMFQLSVSILESGISNTTKVREHIESMLKKPNVAPSLLGALKECKSSYELIELTFARALDNVKKHVPKSDTSDDYDIMIACADTINSCKYAITTAKVADPIIETSFGIIPVFGYSALGAMGKLK